MSEFGSKGYLPEEVISEDSSQEVATDFLQESYKKMAETIEVLYGKAKYWHGTGRFQYREGNVIDVLDTMIAEGGLRRVYNFGDDSPLGISLANNRMYARWYAQLHREEGDELLFQNGSQTKWYRKFMTSTIKPRVAGVFQNGLGTAEQRKSLRERMMHRRHRIDSSLSNKPPLKRVQSLVDPQSNIPGNYGLLFGISSEIITPDTSVPAHTRHIESRTMEDITWNDMTHLEVPLKDVEATTAFLREREVMLPVIPMEMGEIYTTEFSDEILMSSTPLASNVRPI